MPVVFDRYLSLRRKSDEDAVEHADGAEEGVRTPVDRAKAGARLRRFALGVAVGAAIGWLLGRKRSSSATTSDE